MQLSYNLLSLAGSNMFRVYEENIIHSTLASKAEVDA